MTTTLDLNQPFEADGFDPVPDGFYPLEVESLGYYINDKGTRIFALKAKITGESYANRKVWEYFSIDNQTGMNRLLEFAQALPLGADARKLDLPDNPGGKNDPFYYGDFEGQAFEGKLSVKPAENGFDAKNKIDKFKTLDPANPPVGAPQATSEMEDVPF